MRRFALLVVLVGLGIGCSKEAAQSTVSEADLTRAAYKKAGSQVVEFSVPDMMCPEGCGAKVKEILSQQPGAKDVFVDFPSKTAIVAIEKEKFDSKQALDALVDHQFKKSTVKDATSPVADSKAQADAKSVQ
jgi:copper chaperone CopZ